MPTENLDNSWESTIEDDKPQVGGDASWESTIEEVTQPKERTLKDKIVGGVTAAVPRVSGFTDLAETISSGIFAGVDELAARAAGYDDKTIGERFQEKQKGYDILEKKRAEEYPTTAVTDFAASSLLKGGPGIQALYAGGETLLEGGDASDVATSMLVTNLLGRGAEAAGPAIARGMDNYASKIENKPLEKAVELLGGTPTQKQDQIRKGTISKEAQTLLDSGLLDRLSNKKRLAEQAVERKGHLGSNIQELAEASPASIPKLEAANKLLEESRNLKSSTSAEALIRNIESGLMDDAARMYFKDMKKAEMALIRAMDSGDQKAIDAAQKQLDTAKELFKSKMGGDLKLSELRDIRVELDEAVPKNISSPSGKAAAKSASTFRGLEDELAEEAGDAYKLAKTEYSKFDPVEKKLVKQAAKDDKGLFKPDLWDTFIGGGLGAFTAGPAGAMAGTMGLAATRNLWNRYGKQLQIIGYRKAGKLLSNPKYARMIKSWAENGPKVIQSSHYLMMNRDPEYRKLYNEDKERGEEDE